MLDSNDRPLSGLRVVDTSRNSPGPLATMIMADFGAEVIHVVRPTDAGFNNYSAGLMDDPYTAVRFKPYDVSMRGKRSIALDLKSPEGKDAILRLIDTADIFIEEMRPGKAAKLGLGYDELKVRNERLVYCSISGFGQTGPLRNAPGHDLSYLALSGALGVLRDKNDVPMNPQNVLADNGGGSMSALAGILMALLAREKTGRGQHVDVALTESTMVLMTDLYSTAVSGGFDEEQWRGIYTGKLPHFRTYQCKCGGWLAVAALESQFSDCFFTLLERPDLAKKLEHSTNWPLIHSELEILIGSKTRDHWAELFDGEDACVAPALSLTETANSVQVQERNMFPEHQGIRQIGIAPLLSETPGRVSDLPVVPGTHSTEILTELGFSAADIIAMQEKNVTS